MLSQELILPILMYVMLVFVDAGRDFAKARIQVAVGAMIRKFPFAIVRKERLEQLHFCELALMAKQKIDDEMAALRAREPDIIREASEKSKRG